MGTQLKNQDKLISIPDKETFILCVQNDLLCGIALPAVADEGAMRKIIEMATRAGIVFGEKKGTKT